MRHCRPAHQDFKRASRSLPASEARVTKAPRDRIDSIRFDSIRFGASQLRDM